MSGPNEPVDLDAVRRARTAGEPKRVEFDPVVHPGIVYRLYSAGRGHDDVAAALGISGETLDGWLELHPELEEARIQAQAADAEILRSVMDHALGEVDPATGRYSGGNTTLLKFLAQTRLGMVAPKTAKTVAERFDGLTPDQLKREAEVLRRKLAKVEGLAPPPG